MGRWGEAVDCYEKVLKVDDTNGWAWHNLGLDQATLGEDSKALRSLKKAVEVDPDNEIFHMNYGYALLDRKKTKDALDEFQTVVDKNPASLAGQKGLAVVFASVRRYDKSAEAYEKAIELDPTDPDLHLEVGLIYQEFLRDDKTALNHFERYLVLGGTDPVVQEWVDDLKKKVK